MKIIYKEGTRKTLAESTEEARSAVATALELVEDKHGFRTPFEIWRNCELVITITATPIIATVHFGEISAERKSNKCRKRGDSVKHYI